MGGKIFINYRRNDDPGFTQALYQCLEEDFSGVDLFMDVEGHIKPGDLFADVLGRQVAACDVFLAVIGPRWTELLTARSGDEKDFVVIEIRAAIEQGKRVIPVLVGGASLPRPGSLPIEVRPLTERNAVALRPERFRADCQSFISALRDSLAAAEQERAARTETERKAAEAARQQEEAQAAVRAKEVEAVRSASATEGLSSGAVREAVELANWGSVRKTKSIWVLRDHLARFPGGVTENDAIAALDELVWTGLGDNPAIAELNAYLEQFPKGANAAEAKARIAVLEMQARWPLRAAPMVLAGLAFVAGVLYYAAGLATLGRIDISDTLHFFPFGPILSSLLLGFARLKFRRSSPGDALLAGVLYYVGASILQSSLTLVNQQIAAPALFALSGYLFSVLLILLALGVAKALPKVFRRWSLLVISLVLLPALRVLPVPIVQAMLGLSAEGLRALLAIIGTLNITILFAWIGYLMSRSQPARPDDAN